MARYVTQTIASAPPAAGTWTDSISPMAENEEDGVMNIGIYGASWSATVTLQRKFADDATWYDVDTFTANEQLSMEDREESVLYRIGVKQGAFSSGSVAVRLSK